jgi:hypothetical protein
MIPREEKRVKKLLTIPIKYAIIISSTQGENKQ